MQRWNVLHRHSLLLSYMTATRQTLFWKFPHHVRTTRHFCIEQVSVAVTSWTCIVMCLFGMTAGVLSLAAFLVPFRQTQRHC